MRKKLSLCLVLGLVIASFLLVRPSYSIPNHFVSPVNSFDNSIMSYWTYWGSYPYIDSSTYPHLKFIDTPTGNASSGYYWFDSDNIGASGALDNQVVGVVTFMLYGNNATNSTVKITLSIGSSSQSYSFNVSGTIDRYNETYHTFDVSGLITHTDNISTCKALVETTYTNNETARTEVMYLYIESDILSPAPAWYNLFKSGDWETCERTSFHNPHADNDGVGEWQITNLMDFTGYRATVTINWFDAWKPNWLDESNRKDVFLTFCFENPDVSNLTVIMSLKMSSVITNWGLSNSRTVVGHCGYNETFNDFDYPYSDGWVMYGGHYDDITYDTGTITFYMWNVSNQLYAEIWSHNPDVTNDARLGELYLAEYAQTNQSGIPIDSAWLDNMTITMRVEHQYSGGFTFTISDHVYYNSAWFLESVPNQPRTFLEQGTHNWYDWITGILGKVLPPWLQTFLTELSSWFTWLWGIFLIVWSAVVGFVPFLPFVILLWLFDAIFASINEGSLQPMGYLVSTLYALLTSIIGTIATIAGTIWDFIKFW